MKYLLLITLLITAFFSSNAQQSEVSQDWTAFNQSIDVPPLSRTLKFRFTGKVKVVTEDEEAWAGLWLRLHNNDGEMAFFDNMGDRPIKSPEWATYEITGQLDENSGKLFFGGLCLKNGEFYFDDLNLEIEGENGEFSAVPLSNNGFETKVVENRILGWTEGVSSGNAVRVKNYTISSTTDRSTGNYALLVKGDGISESSSPYYIGPKEGYDTQVGTLITMLDNLSQRVEYVVSNFDQRETDWLLDEKANSIGALVMHLAAAEAYYQVFTFENRGFNEEEKEKWQVALSLGAEARRRFQGKDIQYYLNIYREVRKKTVEELAKRNDEWLQEVPANAGISNFYSWFHVMEHQSSHLGQILLLSKRIPKVEAEIDLEKK